MSKDSETQAIEKWLRLVDKPLSKKEAKEQDSKLRQTEKLDARKV